MVSKTVGVLGGMGPAATLDFFRRVLAASGATQDSEHIRLIIDCNPFVPDRNAAVARTGPSPGPALAEMARGLARAGAELLVMPCNTAHAFLDDIRSATPLPVISIVDVTVGSLVAGQKRPRRAGVLATTGCIDAGLYQQALDRAGVTPIVPTGAARDLFMSILKRIKAGDVGLPVKTDMLRLVLTLTDDGAEAIIAGCTEVPLVLQQADIDIPLLNSTDCLVEATIAAARGS